MPADLEQLRRHLHAFDFPRLLVEELGWNRYPARPVSVQVHGATYTLEPAAEKAGFVVYVCGPDPDGGVPPYPVRRKIERQAARVTYEHMVIFVDSQRTMQVWQWVKREGGKPAACREYEFRKGGNSVSLAQRLQGLAFELEEEERLSIPVVALRAQQALDAEKVTKRFYDRFKRELETFRSFIQGIAAQGDREWYASLMLNRMMFVYFIQKQSFLDGDPDYLQNRLKRVQEKSGKGKFQQFYRLFLLRLFHEGLGQPEARRAPDLADLLGKVPYLNGGLFDVHDLERDNPDIQIPDEAFQTIFDFFAGYRWHLDERPHRAEDEINPDVLGYIFEKYVNQKQMGAYYTREDITGYIARNTVIPFLFDAAKKECPVAFAPEGGVWRLLKDNPDRYIYPAVGHGVTWDARQQPPTRLELPRDLPEEIAAGIGDVAKRGDWNRPAPEEYALLRETWRELVARRQRHQEVRAKLAAGEIHEVNDLITLNLDVCQFAEDVIVQSEGPELVRAFWHALRDVSVLDPTCGSGAFLFAALNILEPLYTACLEGMRGFLDDLQWSQRPHHPDTMRDFRAVLDQVQQHPNHRYYVLKSIVVNNLYGVDIMEEAVEICKLRLFLKLVAQVEGYEQIEPLPDVDFNIRPGNTLVGFTSLEAVREAITTSRDSKGSVQARMLTEQDQATLRRIEEEAQIADDAFVMFQMMQTEHGMDAGEFTQAKVDLRRRLDSLRRELDRYLAAEYGIDLKNPAAYEKWRASHQPFHWFVEFYGIMHKGGFDVVIGNPPYVATSKVRKVYSVKGFTTEGCTDIYAWVLERCLALLGDSGRSGMIVPLSIGFSSDFDACRRLLFSGYSHNWFSSFGRIPSALFSFDVRVRNTIHLGYKSTRAHQVHTTRLHRWFDAARPVLFDSIEYATVQPRLWKNRIPKLNTQALASAFERLLSNSNRTLDSVTSSRATRNVLYFKKTAYNWLNFCRELPPCYEGNRRVAHTKFGEIFFPDPDSLGLTLLLANGKIMLMFWLAVGDDFDVTRWNFSDFPTDLAMLTVKQRKDLLDVMPPLEEAMASAVQFKLNAGRRVGNYNLAKCRHVTDQSDLILAEALGLSQVWEDINLYYAQTVRTDFSDDDDE